MLPISATIISKNEATTIGPCLESLKGLVDEIIILDSGSTDGTQALCVAAGATVIDAEWEGFGPQKQRAVRTAKHDWVLCIDADERISPELAKSIRDALSLSQPRYQAYRFARCNKFLGRYLKHGEGYPDWSLRLFNRQAAGWSADAVHEKVICTPENLPIGTLAGDLRHDSAETIEHYLAKQNRYTSLAAGMAHTKRVSALRLVFSPLLRFFKFYIIRRGFLDGYPGLIHIAIGCFNSFIKYAKIYEHKNRPPAP